jgi:23S rRNA G2445 N2-methylase RlmL
MQSVWPFQNKQEKIGRVYVESTKSFMYQVNYAYNSIDDVMVCVFAFIAVDREFEPQSVQTRDYKIEI